MNPKIQLFEEKKIRSFWSVEMEEMKFLAST